MLDSEAQAKGLLSKVCVCWCLDKQLAYGSQVSSRGKLRW